MYTFAFGNEPPPTPADEGYAKNHIEAEGAEKVEAGVVPIGIEIPVAIAVIGLVWYSFLKGK